MVEFPAGAEDAPCPNGSGRLEVLEGQTGRRSWTDEKKARIIAESFAPGTCVNEVVRRDGMQPQHLSTSLRLAREGKIALPHDADQPGFGPVVID